MLLFFRYIFNILRDKTVPNCFITFHDVFITNSISMFYESFKRFYHNGVGLKESLLNRLFANRQLSGYQKKLATHGLDIIINDVRNYLIVLLLSIFFDSVIITVHFIFSFSLLRIHCGGYHAPTKAKCCLTFVCIYLLFLLFIFSDIEKSIIFVVSSAALIYIIFNAPMEHIRNKLSEKEIKRNKTAAIIIALALFIIGFVMMMADYDYYKVPCYSLISNTVLMMMLRYSKNWRYFNVN